MKRNWEVLTFVGNSTEPQSIKRLKDNVVFCLGDYVTNGTPMKGGIEKFDYSFKDDEVYVYTDWSGVGMNLASLEHTQKLPCEHQIGHLVTLIFGSYMVPNCEVIKAHFSNDKVLYDVKVTEGTPSISRTTDWSTRLYNVEEQFVFAAGKEPKVRVDYKKRKLELMRQQKELLLKQLINTKDRRIAALEELLRLNNVSIN